MNATSTTLTASLLPAASPAAGLTGLLAGGDAPSTEQQEPGEQGSFTDVLDGLLAALGQPPVQQPVPVPVPVDAALGAPLPATAEPGEVSESDQGSGTPDAGLPAALPASPDAPQRPADDPVLVALRAAQVLPPVVPVPAGVPVTPAAPVTPVAGAQTLDSGAPSAAHVAPPVADAEPTAAPAAPAAGLPDPVVATQPRERTADERAQSAAPSPSSAVAATAPLAGGAAAAVDAPSGGDDPAPVSRQLADAVQQLVRSGEGTHRMTLRLDPGSLGEVRIHLVVRDGGLQVSLAAGPDALAALGEGADELVRLLQAGGPADVRLSVRDLGSDPQQAGQQPGQQQDREAGQQAGRSLSDDRGDHSRRAAPTAPATTDPTTTARPGALRTAPHDPTGRTSSGVDLSL